MININSQVAVDLELDGFGELTYGNFISALIIEQSGLQLPILQLDLVQPDYRMMKTLIEQDVTFTFKWGASKSDIQSAKFRTINHAYRQGTADFALTLYAVLDIRDFCNTKRIRFFEQDSAATLKSISSIDVVTNYSGSDKQVWIQHNNSDWNFVDRVIDYAYPEDNDCVVGFITTERKLYISSIRKVFSQEPTWTFTETSRSEGAAKTSILTQIKPESDTGNYSSLVSENKTLPVQDAVERRLIVYSTNTDSIAGSGNTTTLNFNTNIQTRYNNGNCHSNYYQAWLNNYNNAVQMNRNILYIEANSRFHTNNDVKIGDLVKVVFNNQYKAQKADIISGKYVVTEKSTRLSSYGFLQRFKLCRDYQG